MPDALDVPVAGGLLRVATWPGPGPPLLAIHGITSSSRSWPLLAQELDRPVVAPDLRGRGRSNALPGPVGLVAHADDCAAALRAVTDEPAVVVGHSMGGFVAHGAGRSGAPDLVRALVLVDGGLPVPARRRGGDAGRPPADQGPAADVVHAGGLPRLVPPPSGVRPGLDPRGRGVRRLRPARRPRPTERRPRRRRGGPARHAREHGLRRGRRATRSTHASSCTRHAASPTTRRASTRSPPSTPSRRAGPTSTYGPCRTSTTTRSCSAAAARPQWPTPSGTSPESRQPVRPVGGLLDAVAVHVTRRHAEAEITRPAVSRRGSVAHVEREPGRTGHRGGTPGATVVRREAPPTPGRTRAECGVEWNDSR